jgi:hypothetical protein
VAAPRAPSAAPPAAAALEAKLAAALDDIAGLKARVAALEQRFAPSGSPPIPSPASSDSPNE